MSRSSLCSRPAPLDGRHGGQDVRLHITAASVLTFGLTRVGAQAVHAAVHSQVFKAISMKDELAHRSADIRWPAYYPNSKDVEVQGGDLVLRGGMVSRDFDVAGRDEIAPPTRG